MMRAMLRVMPMMRGDARARDAIPMIRDDEARNPRYICRAER